MSDNSGKTSNPVHEFKKRIMPHAYREELVGSLTRSDKIEYTFRKACRGTGELEEAKSITVRHLEDLDRSL